MPDPRIYSSPAAAKAAAGALANAVRPPAILTQTPDGRKVILHAGRRIECKTWLACWSALYSLRADQLATEQKQQAREQTAKAKQREPPPKPPARSLPPTQPQPAEPYHGTDAGPVAKYW